MSSLKKYYYLYILASQRNGTLYVCVTNSLARRVFEHKSESYSSFTTKYKVNKLVYYEWFYDIKSAITREKRIKEWKRAWKLELIEKENKNWDDLSFGWYKTIK